MDWEDKGSVNYTEKLGSLSSPLPPPIFMGKG